MRCKQSGEKIEYEGNNHRNRHVRIQFAWPPAICARRSPDHPRNLLFFAIQTINWGARNYSIWARNDSCRPNPECVRQSQRNGLQGAGLQSLARLILSCLHLWTDTRSHYADERLPFVFLSLCVCTLIHNCWPQCDAGRRKETLQQCDHITKRSFHILTAAPERCFVVLIIYNCCVSTRPGVDLVDLSSSLVLIFNIMNAGCSQFDLKGIHIRTS